MAFSKLRSPLFLALAALGLVLLAMETARPRYFLHDDNASWFIGAYLHDYRVLTETGRMAEMNYYQHGGEPFLQQGQTAVLYPPVYLAVALAKFVSGDVIWTIDWVAALHLALGLVGFYFWLRQGGVAKHLAALGALAWVLNPFVLDVGSSWIMTIIIAAWLPWLFWAFDRLRALPSTRSAIALGVSAGLLFLQGYIQWFAYSILFLGLYALLQFVLRPQERKPVVIYYLVVSTLIFAILALPLLLPVLHAIDDSAMRRSPLLVEDALYASIRPEQHPPRAILPLRPLGRLRRHHGHSLFTGPAFRPHPRGPSLQLRRGDTEPAPASRYARLARGPFFDPRALAVDPASALRPIPLALQGPFSSPIFSS